MDVMSLILACSVNIQPNFLTSLIALESGFNPYAIGVVNGYIEQPKTLQEALVAVTKLETENRNYSIGLGQINVNNLKRWGIPMRDAFEPCNNIKLTSVVLKNCYVKHQSDLGKTLSCYYSGNDKGGFRQEAATNSSYVERFIKQYEKQYQHVTITVDEATITNLKQTVSRATRNKPQQVASHALKNNPINYKFTNQNIKTTPLLKGLNLPNGAQK